jgi:hypothetical protein
MKITVTERAEAERHQHPVLLTGHGRPDTE